MPRHNTIHFDTVRLQLQNPKHYNLTRGKNNRQQQQRPPPIQTHQSKTTPMHPRRPPQDGKHQRPGQLLPLEQTHRQLLRLGLCPTAPTAPYMDLARSGRNRPSGTQRYAFLELGPFQGVLPHDGGSDG